MVFTAQELYKTKICEYYQRGHCPRDKCTFAHGEHELRRRLPQPGRSYDYRTRGPPPQHLDRRDSRQSSPRRRSRSPPGVRQGGSEDRWERGLPLLERLGDKRAGRHSQSPRSRSSPEPSPKRLRREGSLDASSGEPLVRDRAGEEGEVGREQLGTPRRSESPVVDSRVAQLENKVAGLEARKADLEVINADLGVKLGEFQARGTDSALRAETQHLAAVTRDQKEQLELLQELLERKNRDIDDFVIKLAKLQKKVKATEDSAWAILQLKKLVKADQQRRRRKQQYEQLLDEAVEQLGEREPQRENDVQELPAGEPHQGIGSRALAMNGTPDERRRRAAGENGGENERHASPFSKERASPLGHSREDSRDQARYEASEAVKC